MAFVAVVLGLLGAMMIAGFVVLGGMLRALAQEQREAREADVQQLAVQLLKLATAVQGVRLDLNAQGRSMEQLTFELQGPPSLRRPPGVGSFAALESDGD